MKIYEFTENTSIKFCYIDQTRTSLTIAFNDESRIHIYAINKVFRKPVENFSNIDVLNLMEGIQLKLIQIFENDSKIFLSFYGQNTQISTINVHNYSKVEVYYIEKDSHYLIYQTGD